MPVEFLGALFHIPQTDVASLLAGRPADRDFMVELAHAHEGGDFDRVLIATASVTPDGLQMAAYAAAHTDRLSYLVSHRPGFRAPTVAAREFATLDQLSEGRVALHVISGASDAEMKRDGDHLIKDERYARTDEYLAVLKDAWGSAEPFDFDGQYYQVEQYAPSVRPFEQRHIPIYFGGSSESAYRIGVKHSDFYLVYAEPLAGTAEQIANIHTAAHIAGRPTPPQISVSCRVILGGTEDLAWERGRQILDRLTTNSQSPSAPGSAVRQQSDNTGFRRIAAAAAVGEIHDRALWTEIARAAGGVPALVGTPETVAQALLDYYDLGVTSFLLMGYDPYEDAVAFGRDLIPLVRDEVRRRDERPPDA